MCARIDQSTCLVEPSCSLSLAQHARLASPSRRPFTTVHREFWVFVRFVRPAVEGRTETDLHLLGHLVLMHHLVHRNLSPGDLGNLNDDSHLRNLHDFLQFGCSTHLRLRFGNFRVCGYWICFFVTIISVKFHSFLCLLRCWHMHQDFKKSQSKNRICLFLSVLHDTHWWELGDLRCTATGTSKTLSLCCTRAPSTVFKLGDVRTYLRAVRAEPATSSLTSACSRRCRQLCR